MPKRHDINSILVIGSGPIIIGQAAEFDYSGTQGCIALKEEGYKVILVNNNPATIMTDHQYADEVYFEPLTVKSLTKIIEKEKPDGLLATLGGQTGLNLAVKLHEARVLQKHNVQVLGTSVQSIQMGEDREKFRKLMYDLKQPVPASEIVTGAEEALAFAKEIGYPIIVRPAYTLGGKGGGIADNEQELIELMKSGLSASPIHQCLVEKSIAGFKEIEYEVMRDAANTCITVCNMENIDPVGIHTGDSIVVAPSQTLTDHEYQMLRSASLTIISALNVVGGCNIQFALDPVSKQYYVIEVNPRVSRSSALASKATGYPIAKLAAKLAVGYTLSELKNPLTQSTFASFEPALDYVVVKFPRWPFDKFKDADRTLGTKMKATGEVMAIERNLEAAIQKAVSSLELGNIGIYFEEISLLSDLHLLNIIKKATDQRFFAIIELLRRGESLNVIHKETGIDYYFLNSFLSLVTLEKQLKSETLHQLTKDLLSYAKEKGCSDEYLAHCLNEDESAVRTLRKSQGITAKFKLVDTCAAEFEARTNYYYSTYFGECELEKTANPRKKVLVLGSGPIRIGQGVEFDYSAVQGIQALQKLGYEAIMINNNPETVSTDFETGDRLYFEPLTVEHVLNVIEAEQIDATIVQFGGQTAINLAAGLEESGAVLLGTDSETLDILEEREKFYHLLDELEIAHLPGTTAHNAEEAIMEAEIIGYPVLIRPSYVIGGKGMIVLENKELLKKQVEKAGNQSFPILIDRYVIGQEAEIDLVADGESILIPAVMEHIEPAGVHSGDSMAIIPSKNISDKLKQDMHLSAKKIVKQLGFKGIMNIQFLIQNEKLYVLEVNPRASRTAPIVSKVMDVPMIELAAGMLNGEKLTHVYIEEERPYTAVKYPVFSSHALQNVDLKLSPEMRSTGEGLCLAPTLKEALGKVFDEDRDKSGISIFMDEIDYTLLQKAEAAGLKTETESFEKWADTAENGVFVSLKNEESREKRLLAAEKGIKVFSDASSFMAYLKAAPDYEVYSIRELTRTGVNMK
ncbi:carbamoyl phosphate synthase large subunit [Bacillus sp. V2I10]|uniref:carbamoyl phosphate synthase large subunit n=1 Tax=Bacillus sp. V2I10 TaxID=3042276 RepID=UPI002785DCF5|nr:carbamoyl phosphate synthase large subunit [Bacillus sp. V2I10]MDQ0861232.1 carbamoyl-phosphate synthase large subunit [Bacillus sp. V2I10]